MYLSRIKLDMTKRKTMLALKNPAKLHGAVENSFAGERQRRLWRADVLAGEHYLLVLSREKGDFSELDRQFGKEEGWVSLEYDPLLKRTEPGTVWRFRLRANPVKSVSVKGQRGTVCGHVTTEYQKKWLKERCEKHGFALDDDMFDVAAIENLEFTKRNGVNKVTLLAVTYEGTLRITDQDAFNTMLTEGLGRGKAYGLGLMTVVRA